MYIKDVEFFLQHSCKFLSALKMEEAQNEIDNAEDLGIQIENLVLEEEGAVGGDPVMEGVLELTRNYDRQLPLNFEGDEKLRGRTLDDVLQSSYDEATEVLAKCNTPEKAGEVAALVAKSNQLAWKVIRAEIKRDDIIEEYTKLGQEVPISVLPAEDSTECLCKDLMRELKILIDSFLEATKIFEEERGMGSISNCPGMTENVSRQPGYRSGDRLREHFSSFINELTRLYRNKIQVLWCCLVADCSCVCPEREFALSFGSVHDDVNQASLRSLKDKCEQYLCDHPSAFHYYTVNNL